MKENERGSLCHFILVNKREQFEPVETNQAVQHGRQKEAVEVSLLATFIFASFLLLESLE